MKFHKEGYPTLLLTILFSTIMISIAKLIFPESSVAIWFAYIVSGSLLLTVIQFFRHPTRVHTINTNAIVAPADGKVVVMEETNEDEYFKDKRRQVSIFMSPVNVHVNRNPISGIVKYAKYHPGKYLVAWHPKSSTENERTTVVIAGTKAEVLFRQVAGALAKRIVYYVKEGDMATQGGEMGFIKFGSRIDLYLPLSAKIEVALQQKTKGGETVVATLA